MSAFVMGSMVGARACVVAIIVPSGSLPHPLCKIPVVTSEEKVVVLSALRPSQPTNLRGSDFGRYSDNFKIVDVVVKESATPLYVVTHSYQPVIWRFHGAVNSITRIISLGSDYEGDKAVGYIGAPNEKLQFIEPLPNSEIKTSRASVDVPSIPVNLCFYKSHACRPDDYVYGLSNAENSAVVKSFVKQKRTPGLVGLDEHLGTGSPPRASVLPAGVLPPNALEAPEFVSLGAGPDGVLASLYNPTDKAPIALDPAEVFSPTPLEVVAKDVRKPN